mgnify:CR=1 FL=1
MAENIPLSKSGQYYKIGGDVFETGTNRPISLDEFQGLGLNFEFIPTQEQISPENKLQALGLSDETIKLLGENTAFFAALGETLTKQYEQNKIIPPTFTSEDLDRIFKEAQTSPDIADYYKEQLRVGQEQFTRNLQATQKEYTAEELDRQKKFEQEKLTLSEQEAAAGRVFSGFREQAKERLGAAQTGIIESAKRQQEKALRAYAEPFEQKYGTTALGQVAGYTPIGGITGTQESARLASIRDREVALRERESLSKGIT